MPNTPQNESAGPRRIVPTVDFVPRGLAPVVGAPIPNLQNHGGPVIGSVEVVPIYWGAAWATGINATLTSQLDGFFDFIVTSPYMDLLNEYSTSSTQIRHGSRLASAHVSGSEPGTVTGSGRQVTDAQIRAFYAKNPDRFRKPDSVSIQTITIAYGNQPSPAEKQKARERAADALKQARATKDYEGFGMLAEKVSMDDWRVMMGDHKWLHRGRMPEAVEKVVFSMKPGEISDVIDTGDSFCIARVNEREDSHLVSFDEVKPQLKKDLERQKADELRQVLEARLRKNAKIEEL